MDQPSQDQDPWRAAAERINERASAAAVASAAIQTEYERRQVEAAERTAEGQRRIDEFLERMRAASDPGCSEHDLTIRGRRDRMIRRRADGAGQFIDDDADELVIQGWIIEETTYIARSRDTASGHDEQHATRTFLAIDGVAYDVPDRSPGGGFGRARRDPAKVTIDMLAETLINNGVEI